MEPLFYTHEVIDGHEFTFVVSERGLVRLSFGHEVEPGWIEDAGRTRPYTDQLRRYFAGELQDFDVPLDLRGTEFQKKCWGALLEIPYGATRTYAELAELIGSPKACRAVGAANGANPIAIVVPCHRVVASRGKLGGYGGGLPLKEKLLRLEGALLL